LLCDLKRSTIKVKRTKWRRLLRMVTKKRKQIGNFNSYRTILLQITLTKQR